MRTPRLFLFLMFLCYLYPVASHAVDVYIDPPAPSDVDSVSITAIGCGIGCPYEVHSFSCYQIDAHTYEIDAIDYSYNCFPSTEVCFTCECASSYELGRHDLGTLAAGHYVVQIVAVLDLNEVPVVSEVSFDVEAAATGVRSGPSATLLTVVPNPFASSATIDFSLGKRARATLDVFDVRGSRVRTLLDEAIDAPGSTVQWDGRDANGRQQPSGIYFARLTLDGVAVATRRIVLLR